MSSDETPQPVTVSYLVDAEKHLRAHHRTYSVPSRGDEVVLQNEDAEGEEIAAEGFVVDRVEWTVTSKVGATKDGGTPHAEVKLNRTSPTPEEYAEHWEEVHE